MCHSQTSQRLLCTAVDNTWSCDSHSDTGAHPFTHSAYLRLLGHILLQRMQEKSVRWTQTIPPDADWVHQEGRAESLCCGAPHGPVTACPTIPTTAVSTQVFPSHGHQVVWNTISNRKRRRQYSPFHSLSALKPAYWSALTCFWLENSSDRAELLHSTRSLEDNFSCCQTLTTGQVPLGKGVGAGGFMFNHIHLTKVPLLGVLWAPGRGRREVSSHRDNLRGRCSDSRCAGLTEKGLIFISHH